MRQTVRRLCFSVTYPWTRPLFCSCCSRMFSSFRGLGMKPISQPSFTNRPIHQSLLNFWGRWRKNRRNKKKAEKWKWSKLMFCRFLYQKTFTETYIAGVFSNQKVHMYLFYMEEILSVEGDGGGWHRNILIQCTTIADVGPYSKCNRFSLEDWNTNSVSYRQYPCTTISNPIQ